MATQSPKTKRLGYAIIGVCIALGFFAVDYGYHQNPRPRYNYTPNICDDAYQTEDHTHANVNSPYVDVVLKEGCFSGFVELPKAWRRWREQFLGADDGSWVSEWWSGTPNPRRIFNYSQLSSDTEDYQVNTPYLVRLQGKGTVRIFRILDDGSSAKSTPPAQPAKPAVLPSSASPTPDVAPIPKPVGPAVEKMQGSLRFGFYHCVHVADAVLCRGYVRSEYNEKQRLRLSAPMTFLSDESGKRYPASEMNFAEKTCTLCEDSLFPHTTTAVSVTFPNMPSDLTAATLILWHTAIQNDNYLRTDVVIDRK
jgi:hypothetical protein